MHDEYQPRQRRPEWVDLLALVGTAAVIVIAVTAGFLWWSRSDADPAARQADTAAVVAGTAVPRPPTTTPYAPPDDDMCRWAIDGNGGSTQNLMLDGFCTDEQIARLAPTATTPLAPPTSPLAAESPAEKAARQERQRQRDYERALRNAGIDPDAPPVIGITADQFARIQKGMTIDEVRALIGAPGTVVSQTDLGGITTVVIGWPGVGSVGANATVMFQNGAEVSKAQFGL